MVIVGLDISKSSTGVAIGDGLGPPRTFRASFSGKTHGQIGWAFQKWFRELLIVENPQLVCAEAAFVAKTDDVYTAKLMLGLDFITQTTAAMRSIDYAPVAVTTWRKQFLGHGFPKNPKQASIAMCNQLGWPVDGNHDKAEACGIWAWGHMTRGTRAARDALATQVAKATVGQMARR